MHAYNCICANVQIACIAALNEGLDAPQYMNRAYIERRNYLVSKLKELGFELDAQEGAFIYSQVFVTILLMISISRQSA